MEEQLPGQYAEDEIDLGVYFAILRKQWWKICGISLAVGVATLLYMFTKPNIYQATAVITPSVDEKKQNPALGALVSFGDHGRRPDQASRTWKSSSRATTSTVRVFQEIQPVADRPLRTAYDPATGKLEASLDGSVCSGKEKGPKPPGDWDAIRRSEGSPEVFPTNKKSGSLFPFPLNPLRRGFRERS